MVRRSDRLDNFLRRIPLHYNNVPYHSFYHAVDVMQGAFCFLQGGAAALLQPMEMMALLLATLCHDIEHPGMNNAYHVRSNSDLARLYNDRAVLENHHCATTFKLLRLPDCNLFGGLGRDQNYLLRREVVEYILITDMSRHGEFMAKLTAKIAAGKQQQKSGSQLFEVTNGLDRQLLGQALIKACDIVNVCKPLRVSKEWNRRAVEEFWTQGDLEKEHGIAVEPFLDRFKMSQPQNTFNFIELARPYFAALVSRCPPVRARTGHRTDCGLVVRVLAVVLM